MIFTQEQIDEIEQKLAKRGAKDTQLPSAKTPLTGDESIAIVQERENRLVPIGSIVSSDGGIFNVSEYLKVKTEVETSVILTLSEAIEACPSRVKKAGQIITFIDKDKEWQRYQYQGYNIENWNQLTLWKDLNNVSEDMPVSEDVMVFNITEYMPGGSKYKQSIWAGIYTTDGNTPVSQYRLIFGCDESLGDVEGVDMGISDTLAIIDITTDGVDGFRYILFVGNSIDGYKYQTTINSDEDVPDWIAEAFGNNSSYILANIASLERRVNAKLADKAFIVRVDDYLDNSKEMPNGYFMFEQQPVSQIRVLYDSDAYLLYIQAAVDGTGTMYFAFENADEYYDSWRYLNQYTEDNCPTHVLEAFGLNVATSNKKGMMSATDKTNLDGSFKNVNYNSTTKKLIFTKNNNTTVELDATPFIKDGMVNSVSIVDGYLVITFNTDSGKETIRIALTDIFNPEDYYTKVQTDNLLGNKVDKEQGKGLSTNDYTTAEKTKLGALPTNEELTQALGGKANSADLAEVATTGSYNDLSNKPDLSGFITNSVDNLVNYYLKSETYTKTEVQRLIGAIQQFHYEVYPTLPQTGASNVLYLIGPTGTGADKYEEYVYANNDWTKIGDTSIDLSGYVTTEALNTALADYYNKTEVDGLLAGKVDKETGKGLSTNDYTDSDKEKVNSVSLPDATYSIYRNQWVLDGNIATNSEGVLKIQTKAWLTPTIVDGRLVLTRNRAGEIPYFKIYSPFEGTLRIRCYEWVDSYTDWKLELGYLTDYPEKYHYLEPFYESSDNTDIAIYVKAGWNTIRGGSGNSNNAFIIGEISLQKGILALNSRVTEHNMGLMTPQLLSDLNYKTNKVSNATNGNFAALDGNGNLTDSGHKHSDYLTQHQDLSNYVQKSQTAGLLKNDGTVDTNTYLTQHQDISGKEDITPIEAVASGTTTITAQVNKYYEVAGTVSSLTVTLPTPTANTEVTMVVVHLTVGANPTVVVTSVNEVVKFSAAYSVVANKEYELSCLYNGSKWIVSSMEVAV